MCRLKLTLICLLCMLTADYSAYAQDQQEYTKIATPGLNPVILGSKEFEINTFYSQQKIPQIYNPLAPYNLLDFKQETSQAQLQFSFGLSDKSRINLGVDVGYFNYSNELLDGTKLPIENSSTFSIAPRIRWEPFRKAGSNPKRSLFLQHKVVIPLEDSSSPNSNGVSLVNQMVYTERLGYNFIFQTEVDFILSPAPEYAGSRSFLKPINTPVTLFLGFMANTRIVLYGTLNYSPEFGTAAWVEDDKRYRSRSAVHGGGGIQFVLSQRTSFFTSYQAIISSENGGGANALTFSLRFSNQ